MNLSQIQQRKTKYISIYILCLITGLISLIIPIIILIIIMKKNNQQDIDAFKYFIENILNFYVNGFLINFTLSVISIISYICNANLMFSMLLIIILSFQIFIIIQILIAITNTYRDKSVKFPFNKKWIRYSKSVKGIIL